MSDLVERLRSEAKALRRYAYEEGNLDPEQDHATADLLDKAAASLEALEAEAQALDQKCSALSGAHGPNTCGCSYDAPGDICAAHSPQLMAAMARIEELERFKTYVHARLDDAGIPTHPEGPHSAAGCRIGDRLDLLVGKLEALKKAAAPFVRAWEGEFFQRTQDDFGWFDDAKVYCVIDPGKDNEISSDAGQFTLGDLRALARAASGASNAD